MTSIFLSWLARIAEPHVALAIVLTVFVVWALFIPSLRAANEAGADYLRYVAITAAFSGLAVLLLVILLLVMRLALLKKGA